jgi:hypothetical protein
MKAQCILFRAGRWPDYPYTQRMAIQKSFGQILTEQYLSHLCDRTFLSLWSYANPFKEDGKELCDLFAEATPDVAVQLESNLQKPSVVGC